VTASIPYTAPARSTFWQKLGPGGAASLLLALGGGLLLLGLPVLHRLGAVRKVAEGEAAGDADAILVLGRRLEADQPSPVFQARLAHAERLWREGRAPRVIVAGGLTGRATRTEAEVGVAWLAARGVPPAVLRAEDRSQHTLENLFFVRDHLRAEGWSRLLLVSDPLHLARASALARGLGLAVACVPAPDCPPAKHSPAWWRRAVTEAFLLHWYHTGMAYSRLIGSKRQLERVT
jgi:uncharacterized SAM-binding protein YcdF (DUF218 family)